MWDLFVKQTPTQDGFERILLFQPDVNRTNRIEIAACYINTRIPALVLAWSLEQPSNYQSSHSASQIIDAWINDVLPSYGFDMANNNVQLEFWMSDQFYSVLIGPPVTRDKIVSQINNAKIIPGEEPSLVLMNYQDRVMEIDYSNDRPAQCACALEEVYLKPFIGFFRKFHSDANVRSESEISLKAFGDPSKINKALNALDPVKIID